MGKALSLIKTAANNDDDKVYSKEQKAAAAGAAALALGGGYAGFRTLKKSLARRALRKSVRGTEKPFIAAINSAIPPQRARTGEMSEGAKRLHAAIHGE